MMLSEDILTGCAALAGACELDAGYLRDLVTGAEDAAPAVQATKLGEVCGCESGVWRRASRIPERPGAVKKFTARFLAGKAGGYGS